MDAIHSFGIWLIGFADTKWALILLGVNAFTESVFNPIPVDPLLFAMAVLRPELGIVYGVVCTVCSVAGAAVGWYLGKRLGRPLLKKIASEEMVTRVDTMFTRYGSWAILIACITPIPYKVFALASGMLGFSLSRFLFVSVIGRGLRFLSIGFVIYFFGESVVDIVKERLMILSLVVGMGVVAVFIIAVLLRTRGWRRVD